MIARQRHQNIFPPKINNLDDYFRSRKAFQLNQYVYCLWVLLSARRRPVATHTNQELPSHCFALLLKPCRQNQYNTARFSVLSPPAYQLVCSSPSAKYSWQTVFAKHIYTCIKNGNFWINHCVLVVITCGSELEQWASEWHKNCGVHIERNMLRITRRTKETDDIILFIT